MAASRVMQSLYCSALEMNGQVVLALLIWKPQAVVVIAAGRLAEMALVMTAERLAKMAVVTAPMKKMVALAVLEQQAKKPSVVVAPDLPMEMELILVALERLLRMERRIVEQIYHLYAVQQAMAMVLAQLYALLPA